MGFNVNQRARGNGKEMKEPKVIEGVGCVRVVVRVAERVCSMMIYWFVVK